ncbi:MAG: polysaccharide biosynthesis tyrosine autokinase [Actinomycetota bacterium]|nr:polysaccharide biosynthesis tyrosine autokinase [Actinomycetota bacterium]
MAEDTNQLELRDYLRVFRRRRGTIALSCLVVVAAALVSSYLQRPVYEGTAEILLQKRSTESLFDPQSGQLRDPNRAVQTEIQVLKSRPVREEVIRRLGAAPKVSTASVGQTDVIQVKAQSTDREQAAAIANAYATAYIDFRRKQAVDDVLGASTEIQRKVSQLQSQIDATQGSSTQALEAQKALFNQKLDQLQVDAALKTGGAQLVTPAAAPDSPISPTPIRSGVLALFVGFLFGVGIAFLLERLDESIKGKEDLERATDGLATLGLIPAVSSWRDRQRPVVVSLTEPKSAAAEAYRALRTSVQFIGLDRPLRTLQVTSPNASEGKTTTLANLAVALAQTGQRVVIVSCDLRRPRVHEFFGRPNTAGFTSVLLGDTPISSALQELDGDGLFLLPSGPIPPNPSELLASRRTREVFAVLQADADILLVDSPPVLPVTDAAVISSRVDATLLVATAGVTTRRELHRTHEALRQVDAPLIGTVLNGITGESAYGYQYSYTYAESDPNGRRGRSPAKTS